MLGEREELPQFVDAQGALDLLWEQFISNVVHDTSDDKKRALINERLKVVYFAGVRAGVLLSHQATHQWEGDELCNALNELVALLGANLIRQGAEIAPEKLQ